MTPKEANTQKKVEELPRDCWNWKHYWFLVGAHEIAITRQDRGEKVYWVANVPRKIFESIIRVYETGSKTAKVSKKK